MSSSPRKGAKGGKKRQFRLAGMKNILTLYIEFTAASPKRPSSTVAVNSSQLNTKVSTFFLSVINMSGNLSLVTYVNIHSTPVLHTQTENKTTHIYSYVQVQSLHSQHIALTGIVANNSEFLQRWAAAQTG